MKSNKRLVLSTLLCCLGGSACADFVGVNIGYSHWAPDLSGDFNSKNNMSIAPIRDLGVNDPSQTSLVLILEHPIPLLPNVKYQNYDLETSGNKTLTKNLTFNDSNYNAGNNVSSIVVISEKLFLFFTILILVISTSCLLLNSYELKRISLPVFNIFKAP